VALLSTRLFSAVLSHAPLPGACATQVRRADGELLLRFQVGPAESRLVGRIREYIQQCADVADTGLLLQCGIDSRI